MSMVAVSPPVRLQVGVLVRVVQPPAAKMWSPTRLTAASPRGVGSDVCATQRPSAPAGCGFLPAGIVLPLSVNDSLGRGDPVQAVAALAGEASQPPGPAGSCAAPVRESPQPNAPGRAGPGRAGPPRPPPPLRPLSPATRPPPRCVASPR